MTQRLLPVAIIIEYGHPVNRYTLTEKGKDLIKDFVKSHSSELEKIKGITSSYFQKPLTVLLNDVYLKYPKLTSKSKIKAEVNKTRTESSSYLNSEYEIPFGDKQEEIPVYAVASQQHVFGDESFRRKLAKSIGLDKAPDLDPKSFDRIKGILSEEIDAEEFDSEELVRGC